MLKLINIKKDYVTKGVPTVHALKGLTVNFRRNEFVAILGQSGCGKTTLLNIIGGLDRYSDGDLIIEGKSTKSYTDRDWDTYRNHSVGFVFQSYNLIGHQTILKNVELALTISGVKKQERKQRALEALKTVGLEGMEKKKPNQLSGGQMQRVAIARSLVNNPEILLADEPTGALDSETSIQIMDLLKEVAKDRLVIMVTHNPDLAYAYANRIVKMSDGLLTDDSNPYKGESKEELAKALKAKEEIIAAKGKKKQTSMSFATATGLSFSNLLSKLKRTILVSIAGSIGIIGVSAVLAVSQGVHNYVGHMQDDMLSEYPLAIAERSVDLSSLMEGLSNWDKKEAIKFDPRTEVGLNSMIEYLMDKYNDIFSVKENDINKDLLAYLDQKIDPKYLSSIEYDYTIDPTNNIFTTWNRGYEQDHDDKIVSLNGLTQLYIAELATVPTFGVFSIFMDLFTNFMKPLPHNADFILNQYDVIASSSPDGVLSMGPNDLVLVVDEDQTLTDLVLGQAGYYSQREFLNIAFKAVKEQDLQKAEANYSKATTEADKAKYQKEIEELKEEIKKFDYPEIFDFNTLLDKNFYYVPDLYKADIIETHKLKYYVDLSAFNEQYKTVEFDMEYVDNDNGGLITGTGFGLPLCLTNIQEYVYDPTDTTKGTYNAGDFVTHDNKVYMCIFPITEGEDFNPAKWSVLSNVQDIDKDVSRPWVGAWRGKLSVSMGETNVDLTYIVDIKADGTSQISFILGYNAEYGMVITYDSDYHPYEYTHEQKKAYAYDAFQTEKINNHEINYESLKVKTILKRKKNLNFGSLERGLYFSSDFRHNYIKDGAKADIVTAAADSEYPGLASYVVNQTNKPYEAFVKFEYTNFANEDKWSQDIVTGHANSLNVSLSTGLTNMFGFTQTTNLETNRKYLRSVAGVSSRKNNAGIYEVSIADKTMTDEELEIVAGNQMPEKISIYPKDFDAKNKIVETIKYWNNNDNYVEVTVDGDTHEVKNRKEISYTDTVELIVNIINTLITTVTIALVAFTSLSLVVSCFMIAVITYISTMERVKEIGVIRSLGGRKKDVSRLFIAECLIIGLASGLIGISVTYLFQVIFNAAIAGFNVGNMADLTLLTAFIMVCISVGLNVISGFIPSRRASKQDPVVALRTE